MIDVTTWATRDVVPVFTDAFQAQLNELFRWRRDVRRFRAEPVPAAVLDGLLETANLAASVYPA